MPRKVSMEPRVDREPPGARAFRGVLAATALVGAAAGPVAAHEFWLAPSRYVARPAEIVRVSAAVGPGFRGERRPYASARGVRFVARADREVDLAAGATDGDFVWTRFVPTDLKGAMIGYESEFARITMSAAGFDDYLRDEGLNEVLEARRQGAPRDSVRERYRRCLKTWLDGRDAGRASRALGLPLEIVPRGRPGGGDRVVARVLREGRPLGNALVRAWRAPLGPGGEPREPAKRDSTGVAWQGRTDARGLVTVPLDAAGEWMLAVVHMVPCPEPSEADWESTWATLTFATRPPPADRR